MHSCRRIQTALLQRETKMKEEARSKEEAARRQRLTLGELSVEMALQEAPYISAEADPKKLSQKARACQGALPLAEYQLAPARDGLAVAVCFAQSTRAPASHGEHFCPLMRHYGLTAGYG
jgi:hypothetical protein